MSLPKYPKYKESGIAGVGAIPAEWDVVPLLHISELLQTGPFGSQLHSEDYVNDGVPVINPSNIADGRLVPDYTCAVSDDDAQRLEQHRLKAGEIVVGRRGEMGRCAVVPDNAVGWLCGTGCLKIRLKPHATSAFVSAWLRTAYVRETLSLESVGSTMENLNAAILGRIRVPLPTRLEQSNIIVFLDRETAKIDELIAEQEKLITLLAEKRQAVISHAVSKGLDPNTPMKVSGVAWLGQVPTHWRVGKIQSFARRESGHTPSRQRPEYWENCTIPWFSLADVWQIRNGNLKYVRDTKEKVSELGLANSSARLLPAGTVILSRTASVGYSAIMSCDMATTQDFVNWVCRTPLKPEFLLYVLRGMRSEFDRLMMGSTHQTIYMPDIAKLAMALPSESEQTKIIDFLDGETEKLVSLTRAAEKAIKLLVERRSALIAAAVTGQIDVRGIASGAAAEIPEAIAA